MHILRSGKYNLSLLQEASRKGFKLPDARCAGKVAQPLAWSEPLNSHAQISPREMSAEGSIAADRPQVSRTHRRPSKPPESGRSITKKRRLDDPNRARPLQNAALHKTPTLNPKVTYNYNWTKHDTNSQSMIGVSLIPMHFWVLQHRLVRETCPLQEESYGLEVARPSLPSGEPPAKHMGSYHCSTTSQQWTHLQSMSGERANRQKVRISTPSRKIGLDSLMIQTAGSGIVDGANQTTISVRAVGVDQEVKSGRDSLQDIEVDA